MGVDVADVATGVQAVVLAEMAQPLLLRYPPEQMVPKGRLPRGGLALASSACRRSIKYRSAKPPSFSKRCVHDVDGLEVKTPVLDSGADTSLVARGVIDALQADGVLVHLRRVADQELKPVGSGQLVAYRVVQFKEVILATSADPQMLRNMECFVDESDPSHGLIVGRPIMKILGYSTDELLVRARDAQTE
ncbi:hypothetical protein PF011_g665 [Phytophthora fragariae]|uniref:Peptidase A2 domain-containing protein n=1 Tax=Phytophthora fragariae TaxID=53985 RepID=A0A6A3MLV2_9STRA|nr:hypothetical protein PF011_g665 [Phytophthora fragariae]